MLLRWGPAQKASSPFAMKSFSHYILLFATTLFVSSSLASPTLPLVNISSNFTPSTLGFDELNNNYRCYEAHLLTDRRAKTIDCLRAAAFLPNLHETGNFYRGSDPADHFALPYVEVYGTCRVKIDLMFGRPDQSSWLVINMALRKVIDACQLAIGGERTGGETTAGSGGRITVTAESIKWPTTNVASTERLR